MKKSVIISLIISLIVVMQALSQQANQGINIPKERKFQPGDNPATLKKSTLFSNKTTKRENEMAKIIVKMPFKVSAGLPDVAEVLSPSAVRIDGWLGGRIAVNEKNRLLVVDTEPLLAGFRKKPGK